jgi:hypothetical protein
MADRTPRPHAGRDDGVSLAEVLVGLGVMSVAMAIVTTGLVVSFRVTGKIESTAVAQSELHIALQRLDREVRYAYWIGPPRETPTSSYVEFLNRDASTHTKRCNRLILDRAARVLRMAQWSPGSPPPAERQVAAKLGAPARGSVFSRQAPGTPIAVGSSATPFTPEFQRLRIRLQVDAGSGGTRSTGHIDVTFTAANSFRNDTVGPECTQGRPQ